MAVEGREVLFPSGFFDVVGELVDLGSEGCYIVGGGVGGTKVVSLSGEVDDVSGEARLRTDVAA